MRQISRPGAQGLRHVIFRMRFEMVLLDVCPLLGFSPAIIQKFDFKFIPSILYRLLSIGSHVPTSPVARFRAFIFSICARGQQFPNIYPSPE